jgi:hypothetical protein
MANISSVFQKNFVFQGPAVVFLGAAGTTPDEIGGVYNVSVEVGLEIERLELGWPRITQELYIKRKSATVKFESCEPTDYTLMAYALGAATNNGTSPPTQLRFGDQNELNVCTIKLYIINVEGNSEEMRFWRCVANESLTRSYDDEGVHKIGMGFEVLRATQDWGGNDLTNDISLPEGSFEDSLFRAIYTAA